MMRDFGARTASFGGGFAARAAREDGDPAARQQHASTAGGRVSSASTTQRRDPGRAKRLAVVAAASAAVAVASVGYGMWAVASSRAATEAVAADLVPTAVATEAIGAGETIADGQIKLVEVPRAFRSEGALDAVTLSEGSTVVGSKAVVDIPAGSQIVPGLVAGVAGGDRLAASLSSGTEAVTVAVDTETGLAGQIRPFDTVRVVSTETAASGEALLRTVCERALVISTGGGSDDLAGTGAITLAVSPEEANAVREAQFAGHVSFVLLALVDAPVQEASRG